jgi:hypothetical protein
MDKEQNIPPFENQIFRMAQERVAEHNAALAGKSGPKTGHIVEVTKLAKVVGRNKVPVCFDEVEHLASLGCTDTDIAAYFGVKEDTLRRGFAENLIKGRHKLKVSLRQAQLRVALEGNAALLVWLGRNMLNQNETGAANEDNRPLPWTDSLDDDVSDLEDEDEDDVVDILKDSEDAST